MFYAEVKRYVENYQAIFIKYLTCTLLFFALFFEVLAQEEAPIRFDKIDLEDGLSQNSVVCFWQDSRGLMWIGTQDGLNLYDGQSFKHFKREADNPNSLSDNFVSSIFEDSKQRLWIGTDNGLNLFDRNFHHFKTFFYDPKNPYSISQNTVNCIFEDAKKQLWVGTNEGLNKFNNADGRFNRYVSKNSAESHINSIVETANGQVWLGTNDGILLWDNKAMRFGKKFLAGQKIKQIKLDIRGHLLAFSGQTIFRKDPNKMAPDVIYNYTYDISDVLQEKGGDIWVSTPKFGLYRFVSGDMDSEPIIYAYSPLAPKGITTDHLSRIYQDRSGVIWIGTEDFGVCKFNLKGSRFGTYANTPIQTILNSNTVRGILEDRFGRLWVGTSSGLDKMNRRTGEVSGNNPFSGEQVNCIFEDKSGNIWIGTKTKGLFKYTGNDISLAIYESQLIGYTFDAANPNSLPSNNVKIIFQDRNGGIWIGTEDGGMAKMQEKDGSFKRYVHDKSESNCLSHNRIRGIYEDKNGFFWISTNGGGLNKFDPKTEKFKVYRYSAKDTNSISTDRVYPVYEMANGTFWVLTYGGGLNKFDPKTEKFSHITEEDGLPNNVLYGVLAKSDKELWFSTNRGITRFDTERMHFKQYTTSDGLQSNEYNFGALYKSKTGEMFFGGIHGLNYFRPDSIKPDRYIPRLVFTDFQINNKSVMIGPNSLLQKHISETKVLELQYDNNSFAISFASLHFANPHNNKYAYKLVGFEKDWVFTNQGVAKYTNLDPGTYTLKVKGSNSDGVWNPTPITLKIVITPPFYRETWFILMCVLLIAASGAFLSWRRERRLQLTQRSLERMVNLRTRELSEEKKRAEQQKEQIEIANRKIKDSIRYAERIQHAIMPDYEDLAPLFNDHFVLFKPRDIVSGDFYWCTQENDVISIALVDCTGHGVPGAFMSVFGFALLEQTVNVQHFISPAQILTEMNRTIVQWLKQDHLKSGTWKSRDGMDMVFLEIKPQTQELIFAGARNSAFLVHNGLLTELKGDKFSIGGMLLHSEEKTYTETVVKYQKGDKLYLTSDGYFDQFGGGQESRKITKKQFKRLLQENCEQTFAQQRQNLEKFFEAWKDKSPQIDDVLVIGIEL